MSPAPVIIAIDGRSGAGKTTLAIELAARLREHHKVSLFHLEDIYPGWNGLAAGIERYVSTVLAPLHRGEPAEWVSWDWTAHYDGDTRTTQPADIVLVEGVGAAAEAARPFLAAVIWADSPEHDRRSRALARDGETYAPYWDEWAAQEQAWLAGTTSPPAPMSGSSTTPTARPRQVLQALPYLPALAPALVTRTGRPPRPAAARRTDRRRTGPRAAVRIPLRPRRQWAVWLDSSLTRRSAAAERSRFSILADDGGPFGQSVRHRSAHRHRVTSATPRQHRGAVLPLARQGLGTADHSLRPTTTGAASPWAGWATSATNSNAKPAAATWPPTPRMPH